MKNLPPYLKKVDKIGILAPAGFMAYGKMQTCISTLNNWGYDVIAGTTTKSVSQNYFSATDEERLKDLQQLLDDKNLNAIICARGGYGMSRMIDKISFKKFRKNPKWIIGFSDITLLLNHIYSNLKIPSLHAPMAAAFNDGEHQNEYILSLKNALEGKKADYTTVANAANKTGKAKGVLVGGNLALLAHAIGTPSDINTKGKILFIEDIGEYLYNIDRMLQQLKRSGKLKNLSALVVGSFTDTKDTERPFGKDVYQIIKEVVKDYDYPVAFDFPVGHAKENYTLKIGAEWELKVSEKEVHFKEK